MIRTIARAPLIVAFLLVQASLVAQAVTPLSLKNIFPLDGLEYDAPTDHFKAIWAGSRNPAMRSFDNFGEKVRVVDGRFELPPRSALRWREIQFRAPTTFVLKARLPRAGSTFEVQLLPPGVETSGLIAFFNRPIHIDDGNARRHDGIVRLANGVRSEPLAKALSALALDKDNTIEIRIQPGGISLTINGAAALEAKLELPEEIGATIACAWGGAAFDSIGVDGTVSARSLRKLIRAGMSAKKDETRKAAPSVSFGEQGGQYILFAEERNDTIWKVVTELRKGRLNADGAAASKADVAEINSTLGPFSINAKPEDITSIADGYPKETYLSYVAAQRMLQLGHTADAMALLEKTVARAPRGVECWRALAALHFQEADIVAAARCVDAAQMLGSDPWTGAFRGVLHLHQAEFEKALGQFQSAKDAKRDSVGLPLLEQSARTLAKGPFGSSCQRRTSPRFLIESDLPKPEVDSLGARLDRYRTFLETAFPLPDAKPRRSRVWIFDSKEEYLSYTETMLARLEGTGGVYHPSLDTLLLYSTMSDAQDQHVLFHESFHQYLNIAATKAPHWLNEGLAEYYGSTVFDGDKAVEGGILGDRVGSLKMHEAAKKTFVSFAKLMVMPPSEFMAESVLLHYAQSWSMVHWFKTGPDAAARATFDEYVAAILRREQPKVAYASTFGALPAGRMRAMQDGWHRFVVDVLFKKDPEADDRGEGK